MKKIKFKKTKISDFSKIELIFILFIIVLAVSFSVPSLARYRRYVNLESMLNETQVWDGSIATSYSEGSGDKSDPYIIKEASEFAYFASQLNDGADYSNTYFKLGNNIVLNNGQFKYDGTNISYTVNDTKFYVDKFTGDLYDNEELDGSIISSVNLFDIVNKFDGYFDGDFYTIYGLYIAENKEEIALFNNLNGNLSNLYFKNSIVYGGSSTSMLANYTNNAVVNNVSVDGYVVGLGGEYEEELVFEQEDFYFVKSEEEILDEVVELNVPQGIDYTNLILKGKYSTSDSNASIIINNQKVNGGFFEIALTSENMNLILKIEGDTRVELDLYDVVIESTYNYPISSGLIAHADNSFFANVINKAEIYGVNVGGLIGVGSDVELSNGYNTGRLIGEHVSGVINQIGNNVNSTIEKVYNTGVLDGTISNFIGNVRNNVLLSVKDSFNTQILNSTFNDVDGIVEINNVYDINSNAVNSGELSDFIDVVSLENIDKVLLLDTLGYLEYVDDKYLNDHSDNLWIYEVGSYPILYIDELNNPVATLNVDVYSWNDVAFNLETRKFTHSRAFNVLPSSEFTELVDIYYYIYNGEVALNRMEINAISEWVPYENVVNLNKEGKYIIYIKLIDEDNNIYYLNSDVLFFDLSGPDIEINMDKYNWNESKSELKSIYIDEAIELEVSVNDVYSEIVNTEYYIANKSLNNDEINAIDDWNNLDGNIAINNMGINVVYVRSFDSNGHSNVVNTDSIVFGGFEENLYIGTNSDIIVDAARITNQSSVVYNFVFEEEIEYLDGYNTNLILNNKLPVGTVVNFIDHENQQFYKYIVNEEILEIPLSDFEKVGSIEDKAFDEVKFLSSKSKNVSAIFDFKKASISTNFNFNVLLALMDGKNELVLSTLKDSIKNTYVYVGLDKKPTMVKNNELSSIIYNSNSNYLIDFEYFFEDLIKNNRIISDSRYENMKTGIAIKMVDSDGEIVDKKYLRNMEFVINNMNYFADSDGVVRIKLADNLNRVKESLKIVTYQNDLGLEDGSYNLEITPYVSYDGKNYMSDFDSKISVSVFANHEKNSSHEFIVEMPDSFRILNKSDGDVIIPFEIKNINQFDVSSLRVSLYKKKELTAYNQEYFLVDLADYSSQQLNLVGEKVYNVDSDEFNLKLDLSAFEKNGYEIRFELYNGNKKVDVVKKKILIK